MKREMSRRGFLVGTVAVGGASFADGDGADRVCYLDQVFET